MTTIRIEACYSVCRFDNIELPDGKTWNDVTDVWVKWNECHVNFKDGTTLTKELCEESNCDYKRPDDVKVFMCDENGGTDYELCSQEELCCPEQ